MTYKLFNVPDIESIIRVYPEGARLISFNDTCLPTDVPNVEVVIISSVSLASSCS